MTTTCAISVALCTFNGERFVAEQLASIFRQTQPPREIVLADDGSTDSTIAIVRSVAMREDPRGLVELRVLPPGSRLGVTANFERAVRACSYELIALSDQDDSWHPDRLERVRREFAFRENLTLLHSDARLVDERGRSLGMSLLEALEVSAKELEQIANGDAYSTFLRRNVATGATMTFRRSLLEVALPFPSSWLHDEWLAIMAAAIGRVDLLPDALIDYRQHGSNQVGVSAPTLHGKIARVLQPRGDRNVVLAHRAAALEARLQATTGIVPSIGTAATAKRQVEVARAAMPHSRLLRIPSVMRLAAAGSYGRYCSRGNADILRDLLQPA